MATATLGVKRKHEETQDDSESQNHDTFQINTTPQIKKSRASKSAVKIRKNGILPTHPQAVLQNDVRVLKDVSSSEYISLQIVTGSYDRGILHGITASIPSHTQEPSHTKQSGDDANGNTTSNSSHDADVKFSDSFLFAAHSSSIRCLGISEPSETGKRTLATGGSDERINLYTLYTTAPITPSKSKSPDESSLPSLVPSHSSVQNPKNKSIGNLIHHDRPITHLHFPPNSNKLFSSSEDNNIAITRTRDWTLLSSIRAPIPTPTGRPSGDTAGPGEVPAGINDFAIHPSQKLMLSVGRGERCLRLWNLMTGKKAGVLNFEREVLAQVGEGKFSSGEGRRVLWSEDGEVYVVVFERGAIVYGLDSKARAVIKPTPPTKLHQVRMLPNLEPSGHDVLAISTEDGRILFFDMQSHSLENGDEISGKMQELPVRNCIVQLGGRAEGISGRVKDFEIISLPQPTEQVDSTPAFLVVTASSDGAVRIWNVPKRDLEPAHDANGLAIEDGDPVKTPRQIGSLVGTIQTGNRITCLGAFVMEGTPATAGVNAVDDDEINAESEVDGDGSENESWDGFDGE